MKEELKKNLKQISLWLFAPIGGIVLSIAFSVLSVLTFRDSFLVPILSILSTVLAIGGIIGFLFGIPKVMSAVKNYQAKLPKLRDSKNIEVPAEVDTWSWGAFSMNLLWATCHKFWSKEVFVIFKIGKVGKSLLWKKYSWTSAQEFNEIQNEWDKLGIKVGIGAVIVLIPIIISILNS